MNILVQYIPLSVLLICHSTAAWSPNTSINLRKTTISKRLNTGTSTSTSLSDGSYTKGAEIFPACNQREFTLADSFPNGNIPPMAKSILNEKAPHLLSFEKEDIEDSSRRNVLLLGSSVLAATVSSKYLKDGDAIAPFLSTSTATATKVMGVPEAVQWIDDNCDRRFLHAVVASDYRFLYRGSTDAIQTEGSKSDLLSKDTYNSPQALELFERVQTILEKEVVNPSNGHLATSSSQVAGEWGVPGSIWPVKGAHYAWFHDGGMFYPRPSSYDVGSMSRDDLIVDGKDCGRDSLEDALRAESCEVMFASEEFLVVPAGLDEKLREALKGSFLV